ncbi:MAG: response regulator [Kouleothrix sp.]|jgi:CheY-like chemotaxis protein|nr:response regulator [Kouleothrix sp.]
MSMILVVEDDPMNRDMLVRRLIWEGYQVITAINGAQAVELACDQHPDLILMDVGIPVLNGWQATRQLKSHPLAGDIPIIILTAYALSEDRLASLDSGCDDYETKPINFSQLLEKMKRCLALKQSAQRRAKV